MGSVKNLKVVEETSLESLGIGRFEFTDNYSVFDWGRMPDKIDGKGQSLCSMGACSFELLEKKGIKTHYRGVIKNESVNKLSSIKSPPRIMEIDLANVPDLPYKDGKYNYDVFHRNAEKIFVIPLEIIFRNFIPIESSLRDRKTPSEVGLSYDGWPQELIKLDKPIVEFSTKFEEKDRYLDKESADRIAGNADIEKLEKIAREVNDIVTRRADDVGMIHEDGKIECIYNNGEILVADVVGTLDENRFLYDNKEISKEYLRSFYRNNHTDWFNQLIHAKQKQAKKEVKDWRSLCNSPPSLPKNVRRTASNIYKAASNLYTQKPLFDVPPLKDVLGKI